MHGIERAEIEQLKQINLKEYLLSFDKDNYRQRNNGTLQVLYGWTFMETVEKLRAYKKRTTPKEEIPHYNKFD